MKTYILDMKIRLISTDKHFEHRKDVFVDFVYIDQKFNEPDAE